VLLPSFHSLRGLHGHTPSAFFPTPHGGTSDAGSVESDGRAGAGSRAGNFGYGNKDTDKCGSQGFDSKEYKEGVECGAFDSEAVKYDLSRRLGASKGGAGSGAWGLAEQPASLPPGLPPRAGGPSGGHVGAVLAVQSQVGPGGRGDEEGGGRRKGGSQGPRGQGVAPPPSTRGPPTRLSGWTTYRRWSGTSRGARGGGGRSGTLRFGRTARVGAGGQLRVALTPPGARPRQVPRRGLAAPPRPRAVRGRQGGGHGRGGGGGQPPGRSPWRQRRAVGDRKAASSQLPQAQGEGGGLFYQGQGQSAANLGGTTGAPGAGVDGQGQGQEQARVGLTRSLSDEDFSARKWVHEDLAGASPGEGAAGAPQDNPGEAAWGAQAQARGQGQEPRWRGQKWQGAGGRRLYSERRATA